MDGDLNIIGSLNTGTAIEEVSAYSMITSEGCCIAYIAFSATNPTTCISLGSLMLSVRDTSKQLTYVNRHFGNVVVMPSATTFSSIKVRLFVPQSEVTSSESMYMMHNTKLIFLILKMLSQEIKRTSQTSRILEFK